MNGEICTDNRFELIAKYKEKLINATNIEDTPEEMAVIDNILFRLWQMRWLDKLEIMFDPKRVENMKQAYINGYKQALQEIVEKMKWEIDEMESEIWTTGKRND